MYHKKKKKNILPLITFPFAVTFLCAVFLWIKFIFLTGITEPQFNDTILLNQTVLNTSLISYHGIPLIVHQTWKDTGVPNIWKDAQQSWKVQALSFSPQHMIYFFWDDVALNIFINQKFPWFSETFHSYPYNIQRVDVARYFLLYHYGGIYADLDVQCKRNCLKQILNSMSGTHDVVLMETKPEGVSNDVMISSRHNPFMKYVISGLKAAHASYILPYFTVMLSTGPIYLTRKFRLFSEKSQVLVVNSSFYGHEYFQHYEGSTWHSLDGKIIWFIYIHKWEYIISFFVALFLTFVLIFVKRLFGIKSIFSCKFIQCLRFRL